MDVSTIKDQYSCIICQNIFENPVKLMKCGHIFCKNCLNDYKSTNTKMQCPMCREKFSQNDITIDYSTSNEMASKQVKCECGKIMSLSNYGKHSETCNTIINQMNQQIKNKNIVIDPNKVQKNRQTFDCTLCTKKNFDRVGYINHIKQSHPKDRGVCSICKCQPWGDPNYKTHILGHINIRHKFDYDTVVDYNDDEDEILKKVLAESLNDK